MTSNPSNADRANWARDALAVFTHRTSSGAHPNTMDRDDLESAIADLICDLFHYGQQQNIDAGSVIQSSARHFAYEVWDEAQEPPASLPEAPTISAAQPEARPNRSEPPEHAPGPYFYQHEKNGCDDTWEIIATDGSYVASIYFCDEPGTREAEESEANARLFAAAPELLGALERLTSRAQALDLALGAHSNECSDQAYELRRAYRVAFGVIAKARGVRP
jgi:hypothetical protein